MYINECFYEGWTHRKLSSDSTLQAVRNMELAKHWGHDRNNAMFVSQRLLLTEKQPSNIHQHNEICCVFLVDRVFKYCKEKQQQLLLRKVTCSSTDPAAHSGCSWWEEANYWESLCYSKRHKLVWLPAKLTNKPHFMSHRATTSSAPSIRTSVWRIITLKNKTTVHASLFNLPENSKTADVFDVKLSSVTLRPPLDSCGPWSDIWWHQDSWITFTTE